MIYHPPLTVVRQQQRGSRLCAYPTAELSYHQSQALDQISDHLGKRPPSLRGKKSKHSVILHNNITSCKPYITINLSSYSSCY